MREPAKLSFFTIVSALACAIVYLPAYGLYRFHDDWRFADFAAQAVRTGSVAQMVVRPIDQHWSPLWHALEVSNFLIAGWEADWFIRSINLVATFLSLAILALLLRAGAVGTTGIVVGLGVLAFHHVGAIARYSFDTYAQCLSDLAVWGAAASVALSLIRIDAIAARRLCGAATVLAIGLLVKEQALSGFAALALMLLVASAVGRGVSPRRAITAILALATIVIAFAFVRQFAGVTAASGGPFRLCATCVPINAAQLSAGLWLPFRTLEIVDAYRAEPRTVAVLVAAAAAIFAVVAAVLYAISAQRVTWDRSRDRLLLLAGAGFIAAWFPTSLLGHVGELYAHTGIFWWAAIVACAVDAALQTPSDTRRRAVAAVAAIYVASLGIGLARNLHDMRATGERTRWYLRQIAAVTRDVPDGHAVLVSSPYRFREAGDYSVIRVQSPQVLVMTGLSPASVRYAVGERLQVFHEEAIDEPVWRPLIERARATGRLHQLVLDHAGAHLRP